MNGLALYARYVSASLRAQAQYPAATLMLILGQCAATSIEILGVFALFSRFGSVGGGLARRCSRPRTSPSRSPTC